MLEHHGIDAVRSERFGDLHVFDRRRSVVGGKGDFDEF